MVEYLETILLDAEQDANEREGKNTIQTKLNSEQLKTLRNDLIGKGYIEFISENDFMYLLSGKPLASTGKIRWNKSKKMAINLLDKITVNFSLATINQCIETDHKPFDSNDRPANGYKEIEDIIKLCDL